MDKEPLFEKLRSIGQQHVLKYFDKLTPTHQNSLLKQVTDINIPKLRQQQQLLSERLPNEKTTLQPFEDFTHSGNEEQIKLGRKLISEGKVGCILVAGGMASRLKYNGPKGTFPITVVKKKSLFQLFAEKIIAAGIQANRLLPITIMTSPLNHEVTIQFFKENDNFGLKETQLSFFEQQMLPVLDHNQNIFLDAPHHIAMGPDGNGSSLKHFYSSGIFDKWYREGVRKVNYIPIDNPLADPFDPELVAQNEDIVIKCTLRANSEEKVGLIANVNDKIQIVEYSELPEEEKKSPKHRLANLSLFNFSMDFIKKQSKIQIPLHLAHKAVPSLDNRTPTEPNSWKFEEFIFDLLPYSLSTKVILYPRNECFAPLKNLTGNNSPDTVRAALERRDREVFESITDNPAPEKPFELNQQFYYPTDELFTKLNEQPLSSKIDYIDF